MRQRLTTPDERGNLIVAIAIIMIVMMIGTALMARSLSNIHVITHLENFSSALGDADAGLSDAKFRIDNGQAASFCVGTSPACLASAVPGAPGVQYKATATTPDQWTIQSMGSEHNVPHAIQATYSRSTKFPFALFGKTGLNFQGTGGPVGCVLNGCNSNNDAFSTYNSSVAGGGYNANGPVYIGSDGVVNCNGNLTSNVTVVYFQGGGGTSGCTNATLQPIGIPYPVPLQNPPATGVQACPGLIQGSSVFLGSAYGIPIIPSGIYQCNLPIVMAGTLAVAGPVQLYVELDPTINLASVPDITIAPASSINGPVTDALGNITTWPVAANLQIYTNGIGSIGALAGQGYTFGGVLYAPQAYMTADGCKGTYYGSVVANTLTCNGTPNLKFLYDGALSQLKDAWLMSQYTEIGAPISVP
ncbi:MAG TPA: hypothetical protein VFA11_09240 [Acidimicrobiales bacterium]|nr:hypothetical protein [Acidimicrobiales bacterium]